MIIIRSIATYLFVGIYVALAGPIGLLLAMAFNWPSVLYWLGKGGVRGALALSGIRYEVEGAEHIRPERAAVYCVNHTSNVEPPVMYLALERLMPRLGIVYKAELHRIPILARGFDFVGFVPIERGNRGQSRQAIELAAARLRGGYSFLIFPEGTRSRTGALLPFKRGGFLMAIRAQVPVVPAAIQGAREAMRRGSPWIRPVTIRVRFAPPVETAGLTGAERDVVVTRVREAIEAMLTPDPAVIHRS